MDAYFPKEDAWKNYSRRPETRVDRESRVQSKREGFGVSLSETLYVSSFLESDSNLHSNATANYVRGYYM